MMNDVQMLISLYSTALHAYIDFSDISTFFCTSTWHMNA